MSYSYNIARMEDGSVNVSVLINGVPYNATDTHPNFANIMEALYDDDFGDDELRDLFDVTFTIGQQFERLSERVTVSSGNVYFDGEMMHNALTDTILQFHREHQDFGPLVNFFEKVETNPNPHSREHLFRWLNLHSYSITDDGDFIAYKGLSTTNGSINTGSAMVDGVWTNGSIPNLPGSVIEMPRNQVTFDPASGCSQGLHVATWDFASSFGQGVTVKVKINPRDVVSVPVDSGDAKMRVCRYLVVEVVSAPNTSIHDDSMDPVYDDDDVANAVQDYIEEEETPDTRLATRIRNLFR